MAVEQWKPIEGYEGLYEISSYGNVVSHHGKTSRILAHRKGKSGYIQYGLSKNGIVTTVSAHRLVAQAFIPNPDNLETVSHKDENPENNHVDNLEWASREDNARYGTGAVRRKKIMTEKYGAKIIARKDGEELRFDSVKECIRVLGLDKGNAYDAIDGIVKTTKGWSLERVSSKAEPNCKPKGKAVKAIRIEDGNEQVFDSARQAARIVGGTQPSITACLKGRRKSAHGYLWSYL